MSGMYVEKVGLQREARMKLTQERNRRRPNGFGEGQMAETITENSLFPRAFQGKVLYLSLKFLEMTPVSCIKFPLELKQFE